MKNWPRLGYLIKIYDAFNELINLFQCFRPIQTMLQICCCHMLLLLVTLAHRKSKEILLH